MVRGAIRRLATAAAVATTVIGLAVGTAPGAATAAAAKPAPKPNAIQIVGSKIPTKIVVQQKKDPRLFSALLDEVSWLASAKPQTVAPPADKLGPEYTVTVLINNKANQVYDLYPLAAGGPRAHRAAKQPTGTKTDGWFFGRLTMSESLRVAGAPLKAKQDVVNGGIGGGVGEDINVPDPDPVAEVDHFLGRMRQLLLLNGAVLVVILFGLAGISYVIRRRV